MNYLYNLKLDQFRADTPTIDNKEFFIKYPPENDRRTCRKVEEIISRFSSILCEYNMQSQPWQMHLDNWDVYEQNLLLHIDFDQMMKEIQSIRLSSNYAGLFSWLIDRSLVITTAVANNVKSKSKVKKNRSLLLKTLYTMNRNQFLKCFVHKIDENSAYFSTPTLEDVS